MPRRAGTAPVVDLENYVPAYLTFIANKWSRTSSRLYLDRFGVGIESWRVIVLLAIEGAITPNRICQVIFMDKAAVSRTIKLLVERGLVCQFDNEADARQRFAELTERGFELHDQIIEIALTREERLLSSLSQTERATLMALLLKVHHNLPVLDQDLKVPHDGEAG